MLIINFSEKIEKIGRYLKYFDVEGEFIFSNSSDENWVDLINNNIEKKLCYCFDIDRYKIEDLNNIVEKINPDICQNLNKSIIFLSSTPFAELPPTNNLPCFLLTNVINDYTYDGKEKYIFGDDFYLQFIALLNIIKDSQNIFLSGNYYGITSAGLFKEQVNEISEILNNIVFQILSDEDADRNNLLYDDFILAKNNMENQIKSFPQNISLERIFKFSKEGVLSQIRFMVSDLWQGKFLENLFKNHLKKPTINLSEGFIGQVRRKLLNTLQRLAYYTGSFIVDYEIQSKKDLQEIDPIINEFYNKVYLKFLDKEKKFFISIVIWFVISALLVLLIPGDFSFGLIILSLIILIGFFFILPRINFKKDLNKFYNSVENKISQQNKKYIDSNLEWMISYVRTLVEEYFEEINPKYGEVLEFLNTIPPYKIYNFNYNYWSEIKVDMPEITNSLQELAFSLNQKILQKEKKYLKEILSEFQTKIYSKISDSHNQADQFWDNTTLILASKLNGISNYLASKNLLKIIKSDNIRTESQGYCLFVPENIKANIQLNFSIRNRKNLKTKSFIILAWIETYNVPEKKE